MGTHEGIITKPQPPPKPRLRGDKWHRATDIIQKKDKEEAEHHIRSKRCSMPTVISRRSVNEKGLDSSPQSRPVPKPRLHKPPPHLDTLSQPADDNNLNVSSQSSLSASESTTSSDISSEADTIPVFCPLPCPCVCHNTSKHEPGHEPQLEDNHPAPPLDKWNFTHHENSRRLPPNVPIPARPLPKEPQQIILTDEKSTDTTNKDGVYEDIDLTLPPPCSQLDDMTGPRSASFLFPSSKPVPAPRTHNKEKITAQMQTKHRETECIIFDNLRNELQRILSGESPENEGDIRNPMKDTFVKFFLSKSMLQSSSKRRKAPQTEQCLFTSQKKTHTEADKAHVALAVEAARKASHEKSPVHAKPQPVMEPMARHLPVSSASETTQTSDLSGLLESLWQERSVVKGSGILIQLTKEEIQLQESIYEVATSEQSYLDGLIVAVDHFQECPALKLAITTREQKSLFSGIRKIRAISQSFMETMVQKLESTLTCDTICDVVHHYATGPFGAYVDYIRNMPYQKQTLLNLRKENPQVVEILSKLQEDPCCNRLPLDSFLSLPFQRIPRLKILMETVLKRTPPGSDIQASAESALMEISKVLEACNREVGKMKQMEELVLIANRTEFQCKALPLVSSSRWLIREGDLAQLSLKENIFGQKKLCSVHLFLFNDLLLVATRKGSDRYVVQDHVHRSLIEVTEGAKLEEDLDGFDLNRVFQLALVKNHRGVVSHYFLQASTQTERDSWLDVLSAQRDEEEGVYEEWDCPQVRCTEVYQAQQPGELSLQKGDIVNIIQKTSNGYMEGCKLHDGTRGCFPAACVKEISTEYLQRRHLRERYRVLQTAARVIKRCSPPKDCRTTACFK